jgi:hypothetical protein
LCYFKMQIAVSIQDIIFLKTLQEGLTISGKWEVRVQG